MLAEILNIKLIIMKSMTKTTIVLLGMATVMAGASAYAQEEQKMSQLDREALRELRKSGDREAFKERAAELGFNRANKLELNDEQKVIIDELRESDDQEAIKAQLDKWDIEKPLQRERGNGLKVGHILQDLSEEQKEELKEVRASGDKDAVREKLDELGIELPQRIELTDEQKEAITELKEAGDKEAVKEYFEEIGLKKPRKFIQKRAEVISSLSTDEQEVLQEARDIAHAGDKETAKEMLQEVFGEVLEDETKERGIRGFFKRLLGR